MGDFIASNAYFVGVADVGRRDHRYMYDCCLMS